MSDELNDRIRKLQARRGGSSKAAATGTPAVAPISPAASETESMQPDDQQVRLHAFLAQLSGGVAPVPTANSDTMLPPMPEILHEPKPPAPGPAALGTAAVAPRSGAARKKRRKPAEATRILTVGIASSSALMLINVMAAHPPSWSAVATNTAQSNQLVPTTRPAAGGGGRTPTTAAKPGAPATLPSGASAPTSGPRAAGPSGASTPATGGGSRSSGAATATPAPSAAPAPAPVATAPRPTPTAAPPAPTSPPTTAAPAPTTTTPTRTCPSGQTKC